MRNLILFKVLFLYFFFFHSVSHADITTGLVGYWNFDEGSGVIANDSSVNGNNGTLVNGPTWMTGKFGGGISFDGIDDKVDAKNVSNWDLANINHSLSLWFKASINNPGSDFIVDRFTGGTPGAGYLISLNSNGSINFSERADDNSQISVTDSSKNYEDDTWHHIVAIVDISSKTGTLYIDGINKGADFYSGNLINQNEPLTFGNDGSNNNYAYAGLIDDVRIYNKTLSLGEVSELYDYGNAIQDITPPFRSNGSPTQKLPNGTSSINLTLNTNENSTCKYSTSANVDYNAISNNFSSTGGTSHSTTISGLNDSGIYNYYVKCQDIVGNINTNDYKISFTVGPVTYYISTDGSDDNSGTNNYPWSTFSYSIAQLQPGDTLVIKNGTYYQALDVNISGTQTNPILIRAQNDGKAIIDGQGIRRTCRIMGTDNNNRVHDIVLTGILCINSSESVVDLNKADRIILKRISAANAGTGNYHVFDISNTTDILMEDVAAYGTGRQSYDVLESSQVTLRRCWGQWGGHSGGGGPNGFIQIYGTDDSVVENCVGTMKNLTDTVQGIVVWANTYNDSADRNKIYGNIVYNLSSHPYADSSAQHLIQNNEFINNVSLNNLSAGVYQRADSNMLVENFTCVNTTTCFSLQTVYRSNCSSAPYDQDWAVRGTIKNSSLLYGNVGIQNDNTSCGLVSFSNSYNNIYGFNTPYLQGASIGQGEISLNPNYATSTYGNGAFLFIPQSLKELGENNENIGAEILYRYQNGVLTNEPLWSWPMEDRIFNETGTSVTWESNGGLWKTLDGVYGNSAITSSAFSQTSSANNFGNSGGGAIPGSINPGISVPITTATTTATSTPNQSDLRQVATSTSIASSVASSAATSTTLLEPTVSAGNLPLTGQATTSALIFTKILKSGQTNKEVKNLQEFLSRDKEVYPEGLITGYYGQLTVKAVQRFQKKHGIVSTGSPETTGYGLVGPKTIAKLNELLNNQSDQKPTTVVGSENIGSQNKEFLIIQLKQQVIELMMKVIELMGKKQTGI